MVIWLSSFPRSGNTLFRIALKHLGVDPTYSIYEDAAFKRLAIKDFIAHESIDKDNLDNMHQEDKLYFVKTHELPGNDSYPAIYIIRDGRDASVSLAYFMKDVESNPDDFYNILSNIIDGKNHFGSWADHVSAWRQCESNIVFVKFEELIKNPIEVTIDAIKALGIDSKYFSYNNTHSNIKFDALQNKSPKFFRSGKVGTWKEIIPSYLQRHFFWLQGQTLLSEGYEKPDQIKKISGKMIPEIDINELGFKIQNFVPIMEQICMPPYYGEKKLNDFNTLVSIASQLSTKHIFEYGTAYGNTTANLCKYCDSSITTLNALPENISGVTKTYKLKKEAIGEVYKKFAFSERVKQIYEDSLLFVPEQHITGKKFGLVIIDACHDFEYVLNDFLKIIEFVEPDGLVLFHDCHPNPTGHLKGVWKACRFLSSIGFDIKHIKGTWWGCWQKLEDSTSIDKTGLLLLDHIIYLKRNELALNQQIEAKDKQLDRIRKIPGYQMISNILRKFNIM